MSGAGDLRADYAVLGTGLHATVWPVSGGLACPLYRGSAPEEGSEPDRWGAVAVTVTGAANRGLGRYRGSAPRVVEQGDPVTRDAAVVGTSIVYAR